MNATPESRAAAAIAEWEHATGITLKPEDAAVLVERFAYALRIFMTPMEDYIETADASLRRTVTDYEDRIRELEHQLALKDTP